MPELLQNTAVQLILGLAALGISVAIGYYVGMSLRQARTEKDISPEDMLNAFSEMRAGNQLTAEEFQVVKRYLGDLIRRGEKLGVGRPTTEPGMTGVDMMADLLAKAKKADDQSNDQSRNL